MKNTISNIFIISPAYSGGIKSLVLPLLALIVLALCYLVTYRYGVTRLISERKNISELKKQENIMSEKIQTLRSYEANAPLTSTLALQALPVENPALLVNSRLKDEAVSASVIIRSLKMEKSSDQSSVSSMRISLAAEGPLASTISFVKSIETLSPIITLESVETNKSGDNFISSIILRTYWSKLPEKIPGIGDPLPAITQEEGEVLANIRSLKVPYLPTLLAPQKSTRTNPFE